MNKIEKHSVQDIYNTISNHFDNTRHFVWPSVKEFLEGLPKYTLIADIGCGNGKNMCHLNNDYLFIGMDFSIKLLDICSKKKLETCVANNCILPFKNNIFDNSISIAVVHHLSTPELRLQAIDEILRITKPNGLIMIQVWAFERDFNKTFDSQDAMVPWKTKTDTYYRYYYLFKINELDTLISKSKYKNTIVKSYKERDNYIVIFHKN